MAISNFARYVVGAAALGALMAGCAGGSPSSTGGALPQSGGLGPNVQGGCTAHGGMRVSPCNVDLNASNPGPVTVTVRNPRTKKGTVAESDTCGGPSGIATVALSSGDDWTVTAGATAGTCTATFTFSNKRGKQIGSATLNITNEL